MKKINFSQYTKRCVLLYLCIYSVVSFLFLTDFPWVHSDESWLAGLSQNIAEHADFSITEAFFDAKPRFPHAIKLLFHALQIAVCSITSYSVVSVRLISLITCVITLYIFYYVANKLLKHPSVAFLLMVIFSCDIQFIYTSHMARQESLLLFSLILSLYIFFKNDWSKPPHQSIVLGIVTGLSIGLHPNSFILATTIGGCYLAKTLTSSYHTKKDLFTYIGITGAFAGIFVAISYSFDSKFLSHYFANGADEFGIDATPMDRINGLFQFFRRLFFREGGTYYVADIRLQLLLFLFAAILMLLFYLVMRKEKETKQNCQTILTLLFAGIGTITGIYLIGRYSQLSIIFLFPIGWLLLAHTLSLFDIGIRKVAYLLLLVSVCSISFINIKPFLSGENYNQYIEQISEYANPDDEVIANLNMNFYFENGALHDYRNLPYVMESDGNLDTYIEKHQIAYIFYSAELDYYYQHRPYYNALYGNIMFTEELRNYCDTNCEYLGSFYNSRYSPRILELIGQEKYSEIRVYKTIYAK